MRNIVIGCLLTVFLCCEKPQQKYFSQSPEITSFKTSISQYNNGDWESWRTLFADTAKLYINAKKSITATDLENAQKEMLTNFSSYGFEDEDTFIEMIITDDGETWVNYWANWQGTLIANNTTIDVPVHITAQYIDGKIVELYDYYDSAIVSRALAEIEKANNTPIEDKTALAAVETFVSDFFNKQGANPEVVNTILAANYTRHLNGNQVAASPEEFVQSMQNNFTAFPDFHIKLLNHSPLFENTLFIHWKLTGTNTGEFNQEPATGKKVSVSGLSKVHFNGDGKINKEDVYYNQLDLMTQLGKTLN